MPSLPRESLNDRSGCAVFERRLNSLDDLQGRELVVTHIQLEAKKNDYGLAFLWKFSSDGWSSSCSKIHTLGNSFDWPKEKGQRLLAR